ncbi:uncharacterized protein [Amphiura filiformis]|uniref:uncharacterized protein isoform X2 n=1 Tax=Amphiura filiformis TaxID=82378 RepID=UPI003B225429
MLSINNNAWLVVFNFYETITPASNYPSFLAGWRQLGKFVDTLDHYVGTQLQKNTNPNERFPYVNFAIFQGSDHKVMDDFINPGPELMAALIDAHGPPGHQVNFPGGYKEVATFDGLPIAPDLPPKLKSYFLMACFRPTDDGTADIESFEHTWQESTGAAFLKKNNTPDLHVGNIGLYRLFTPPGPPYMSFPYVIRCELNASQEGEMYAANQLLEQFKQVPVPHGFHRENAAIYRIDPDNVLMSPINHWD